MKNKNEAYFFVKKTYLGDKVITSFQNLIEEKIEELKSRTEQKEEMKILEKIFPNYLTEIIAQITILKQLLWEWEFKERKERDEKIIIKEIDEIAKTNVKKDNIIDNTEFWKNKN